VAKEDLPPDWGEQLLSTGFSKTKKALISQSFNFLSVPRTGLEPVQQLLATGF
jgi:hypothetical protein